MVIRRRPVRRAPAPLPRARRATTLPPPLPAAIAVLARGIAGTSPLPRLRSVLAVLPGLLRRILLPSLPFARGSLVLLGLPLVLLPARLQCFREAFRARDFVRRSACFGPSRFHAGAVARTGE